MMKNSTNRMICFLAMTILCLTLTGLSVAERLFGEDFLGACGLPEAELYNGVSLTVVDGVAYQLMRNGDVYTWDEGEGYRLYTSVQPHPTVNVELPLQMQSEELYRELSETVSALIPSKDALYGFNAYSGMIGIIDKDGWHAQDVRLDASRLARADYDNGFPQDLRNAYIEDGKLYAYHDLYLTSSEKPETKLLQYDLSNGACDATSLPDVITFVRYEPGKLLCVRDVGADNPVLAIYDVATATFADLRIAVPITLSRSLYLDSWELHTKLGGLACDAKSQTICLADAEGLWKSVANMPFARVETGEHWAMMMPTAEAWLLPSGSYVTQNCFPYVVKP